MRGQLLEDMRKAHEEETKVSVHEYKVWLLGLGMGELQARNISNVMYNEQLAMSVPLVMGMLKPNRFIGISAE